MSDRPYETVITTRCAVRAKAGSPEEAATKFKKVSDRLRAFMKMVCEEEGVEIVQHDRPRRDGP